jgi:choline dehydrogenase-like flavoprotein
MLHLVPPEKIIDLKSAQDKVWDVIVIGAGMGGGTLASDLVKSGIEVLLLDKGAANFDRIDSVTDDPIIPEEQLISGKFPTLIRATIDNSTTDILAPMGCGMGGSTLVYAAALQRLDKSDFEKRELESGATLEWPYSYDQLEKYYERAESIFSVCGTKNPLVQETSNELKPPPPMCEQDQNIFKDFVDNGLHPYRLHVGAKYVNDCNECGGFICNKNCKQDSYNACIVPALETNKLFLSDYTEAVKLYSKDKLVDQLKVQKQGQEFHLKAKIYVLASGAYFSPILLLNSKSKEWPNGLANSSGLVGRNLMFHANDYLAVWPSTNGSREGNKKTIALRDFYNRNGNRYAEIQSTGLGAEYGLVLFALKQMFDVSKLRKLKPLRELLRIPAKIASIIYGSASVFSVIIEDYPYPENRVLVDENAPSGMRFEYIIHEELKQRVFDSRKVIRKALKTIRTLNMNPHVGMNHGHPCGTLKAGHDPKTSVVNSDCRTHDITNLYVADSSFMPTSGATNPSLTIAANALKVSESIQKNFNQK